MKKVITILSLILVLSLVCGCGGKKAKKKDDSKKETVSSEVTSSVETESVDTSSVESESAPIVSSQPVTSTVPKSTTPTTPAKTTTPTTPAQTTTTTPDRTVMPTSASPVGANDMEAKLFNKINEERQKGGVAPLRWSSELYSAAKIRAQEALQLYSHTRPDGTRFNTVFLDTVNKYTCSEKPKYALGENLCLVRDIQEYDIDEIVDSIIIYWVGSSDHYNNLMNRGRDAETGQPALYTASALAVYSPDNGASYYVEQVFGDFFVS